MQNKITIILKTICNWAIALTLLMLLLQFTVADNISISNDLIDNFLHFGKSWAICFLVFLVPATIFFHSGKLLIKTISGITGLILSIPVILFGWFLIMIMFRGEKADARYYFSSKNGFSYYIKSERLTALDGSELHIYKERPLFFFVKERLPVKDEELNAMGIKPDKIRSYFIDEYFKKAFMPATD